MEIITLIYSQHKVAFWQMFALTLLSGALGIGTLSYINHHFLRQNQMHSGSMFLFILLILFYFIVSTLAQIQLARLGQQFIYTTQIQFVKRIMDSDDAQIQWVGKPKILASLGSDVRSLSFAFTRLPELVQGALFTMACSVYLIYLSPKLFAVTAILMAAMIFGTDFVVRQHFANFKKVRHAEDEIQRHYEIALNGHKELKLNRFRAERFFNEEVTVQAALRRDAHTRADSYHAMAINWGNSMMLAAVGVIFYLSIGCGWANLSDAATITMTVLFMRAPLTAAIGAFPAILQSQVGLAALRELGLVDFREGFHGDFKLPENWHEIRLENVTYSYPVQGGQHFALQPISLTIKRGETLFLIGANGSGKSTLSMMLAGLYAPTSGKIFVDNIEITEENRDAYRQLFASVFTDFHLFEQIVNGMGLDVADEQIARWLAHLQLSKKVKIEKNRILNSKLSQGQRKRLGLMLAALEARSIMILDEWAADQDPQFRRVFYEQLLPILREQGYTIFAISHDDKYFHHAERILSMKQGQLSELDSENAKIIADEHSRE